MFSHSFKTILKNRHTNWCSCRLRFYYATADTGNSRHRLHSGDLIHSPGVRKHCQIIFACLLRKSSVQTRIAVISSFATTLLILGVAGALQLLKLAWQFYWQRYWQVGNSATKRCRCQLRFGHKLYAVDHDLFSSFIFATTGTQQRLGRTWQVQSKQ